MTQIEYKVVKFKGDPGTDKEIEFLNEQSKDGWEHYYTYIGVLLYYFKRQMNF
jgi:hypothetical protein